MVFTPRGSTPQEIEQDVQALRRSFKSGATRDLQSRRQQLHQLMRMLDEGFDELKDAVWKDLHKNPMETFASEISVVNIEIQQHIDFLEDWTKPERVATNLTNLPGSSHIYKEPLGVVCVIGTWNYPLQVSLMPLIGAISAGNTAILRLPGDDTCVHTNAILAKLLRKYLDKRIVRLVHGGLEATKAMLEQKFDLIFCTGGSFIGKIVAEAAAKALTPVILELGGKSPVIVDESADLSVVIKRLVWGAFINAGQTCVRPDYALVNAKIGDRFVQELEKTVVAFFGSDAQQSESYGRIINARSFARVASLLAKDTKSVTFGGCMDEKNRYIAPTLLNFKTEVAAFERSAVMSEEIFGPVLPIRYYEALDDAIAFVNKGDKPLALYVFSKNDHVAERVLMETSSGGVCVNDCIVQLTNPNLPFGGVGGSGYGVYHGKYSFDAFSHRKSILKKSTALDLKKRYQPYVKSTEKVMRKLLKPIPRRMKNTIKYSVVSVVIGIVAMTVNFVWL